VNGATAPHLAAAGHRCSGPGSLRIVSGEEGANVEEDTLHGKSSNRER